MTLPDGFVQAEPWTWSIGVRLPNFDATCHLSVELEASAVVLNTDSKGAITGEPVNFEQDVAGKAKFDSPLPDLARCSKCPLAPQSNRLVGVSISDTGTGTVQIPATFGPGRFLLKATAIGRDGSSSSKSADVLLTTATFASADQLARRNMKAHAEEKLADRDSDLADARGLDPDVAKPLLDEANTLDRDAKKLQALASSHRQFLRYEKATGGDRLVEVFGDLVAATQVVVSVPGLGQEVAPGHVVDDACSCLHSATWVGNAERIWQRAGLDAGVDRTAVLAYLGYDAPNFANVSADNAAENGAGELQRDLTAWGLTGTGAKRLVIVGHSYGSLMAGIAVGNDLAARDLIVAGSPGMDIEHTSDRADAPSSCTKFVFVAIFGPQDLRCCPGGAAVSCYSNVPSSHTWVLRFDGDPVTRTYDHFGVAPDEDDFGAIELQTEPPQCDQSFHGMAFWDIKCHSRYFNWNQTSLENLVQVVLGHYSVTTLVGSHPHVPGDLHPPRFRRAWPMADLHQVDWKNRTYSYYCDTDQLETHTLMDGDSGPPTGPEYDGIDTTGYGVGGVDVRYGDVTGDGKAEALVSLVCAYSQSYATSNVLVFGADGPVVTQLGSAIVADDAVARGGALVTTNAVFGPNDMHCCPSSEEVTTWRFTTGSWQAENKQVIPSPH